MDCWVIKCVLIFSDRHSVIKRCHKTWRHSLAQNLELWTVRAPAPHPPAPSAQEELFLPPGSSAPNQSSRWWRPWGGRRDTARRGGTGWVRRRGTRTWQREGWRPPWGRRRRGGVPQTSRTAAQPGSKSREQSSADRTAFIPQLISLRFFPAKMLNWAGGQRATFSQSTFSN